MEEKLRKSGNDIIGDIPWGAHLCQFYQTKDNFADILAPYFKAGLENNEFCMWVCWDPLRAEEAKALLSRIVPDMDTYIKRGQIEIVDYSLQQTEREGSGFTKMKQFWIDKGRLALERGFAGLRLASNTCWLEKKEWRDFRQYEEDLNAIIKNYRVLAICSYSLDKCGPLEIMDVVSTHKAALIRREGRWVLVENFKHKKIEEDLRESEMQFGILVQTVPDIIYEVDEEGKFRIVSDGVKSLGYNPEELVGKHFKEIVHPDDIGNISRLTVLPKYRGKITGDSGAPKLFDEIRTQERRTKYLELRLLKKKKEGQEKDYCCVELHSSGKWNNPLTVDGKKLLGSIGIIRDITERKKMENQLLFAAKEWRMTFDSITDLVSIHDKDFKITRVNRTFADVFKMRPEEIIGKTCYALFHETKELPSSCPYKQVMQTKKTTSIEFFEPQMGMHLECTCSPVLDQGGEVVAVVHLAKDITIHKEMEKEQRLAQLGKLVADMAHEVNNPLMIISGNAQLSLMEDIQNEIVSNNLKIIFEESKRAKDIIQRLLKFSRPSKGELQATDINKSIEAVLSIVEHQFNLANIEIKRNYSDNLPSILIDEHQMQEVFMNLLNNAKDAMPESGVIEVATSLEGDFLRIDFKDTGCGMSGEVMKRLFEPFFTTKEKGTGLGLSICYGIIKVHNGELKIESELGKGTTASILLPL